MKMGDTEKLAQAGEGKKGQQTLILASSLNWRLVLLLAGLALAAYWPAFNNHFISDDYVILERLNVGGLNLAFLFEMPPENFRLTSYAAFGLLKAIFGYRSEFFYAFTILVHVLNGLLLWKLITLITGRVETGLLAAVLFVTIQDPLEAVMWLAGMSEVLMGLCALVTLILWMKGRYFWSLLFYLLAFFSKESALAIPFLLILVEFWAGKRIVIRREHLYFLVMTFFFGGLFLYTSSANHHIAYGFYAFGPHALGVWANSLHRLALPWFYLALSVLLWQGGWRSLLKVRAGVGWMMVSLLPYVFLTYMGHVPSRNVYLASMGLVSVVALMLEGIDSARFRKVFVAAFLAVNIGYIWFVKDGQLEERAAHTTRLVEELQRRPPAPLLIENFPQDPLIAKFTTRLVPGWEPQMLRVNEEADDCLDCPKLRWNAESRNYAAADN